jgi:chemotaxis signal transduction protein
MSRMSQRLANRRAEPLQKLIVFRIRQEWFAVPIQFAQKVVPLGVLYGASQGGISLTRYQDQELPVIDVERRVFGHAASSLSLLSEATLSEATLSEARCFADTARVASHSQFHSPTVASDQRHLMVVEDMNGSLIGIPFDSPPMLRRVPKSAFAPIPALYLAQGNIQCVSALITVSESEPPFFLLNLEQLLQSEKLESRLPPIAATFPSEENLRSVEAIVES